MEVVPAPGEGASSRDLLPAGIGQKGDTQKPQSKIDPALLCSSYFPTLCGMREGGTRREKRGSRDALQPMQEEKMEQPFILAQRLSSL